MRAFRFSSSPPPIALLSDFGFKDNYVGVMKGVIYRICPEARVIDLCHNIMPQDVAQAAFVLLGAYGYFPQETIFVNVVDPGVGSQRRILCMRANQQVFLAPDNGLLSLVANQREPEEIYEVTNSEYLLESVSATFHGRDIFAPVAAHIASGVSLSELGSRVEQIQHLRLPKPLRTPDGRLRGEVTYVDQFGNLITNVSEKILRSTFRCPPQSILVRIKDEQIRGISRSYMDADEGEVVALVGSSGYLEIAVNRGSAEEVLEAKKGDRLRLSAMEQAP